MGFLENIFGGEKEEKKDENGEENNGKGDNTRVEKITMEGGVGGERYPEIEDGDGNEDGNDGSVSKVA